MTAPSKYDEKSDEIEATVDEQATQAAAGKQNTRGVGGAPSSTFWHFADLNPINGTFRFNADVGIDKVNASSQIAVSITERSGGTPVFGDAQMSVMNVVPQSNGTVWVRANVNFGSPLPVRLNFIIFN